MKTPKYILDKILEAATQICLFAMIVVVAVQIFARLFLPQAPSWTEEATRIFFIFIISFASGLAVRDKAFINVEVLTDRLPQKVRQCLEVTIQLVTTCFMVVIMIYAVKFTAMGATQRTTALQIPSAFMFCGMVIISFGVGLYSLIACIQGIQSLIRHAGNK